ncbi:hypothetical protein DSM106972_093470 [Dulcicalothrix desertica PCC 7102]|uniref:Uncharacterized protein n=1 Tax=Dulcicalothrix desertica PCC 7102 TaxID=232991 RepID=A0A3S1BT71_9CYAN|nr:hypothetical protein [Dulcicalothrix desertica]RUS94452.1 hypothetical protein DSM106972_093470 [Dulcicalothrix desertica PCC 7102]TWH61391.1 hypothetical protein CAL7102_00951 [Dulcicalothrix desertica PCC 7102]
MTGFIPPRNRDASDTIRGYVYQVDLTIERWLNLQPDEYLQLECGEDIDLISRSLVGDEQRLLEQVKNYTNSITLWSSVAAIANFVEHRHNNSGSNLRFLYTTTASVTLERPSPPMLKRNEGIFIWEQIRQGSLQAISQDDALTGIRNILSRDKKPDNLPDTTWNVFRNFITTSSDDDLLDLINKFQWSTEALSAQSLSPRILEIIIQQQYATNDIEAEQLYQRLFLYVFKLLSQPSIKQLAIQDLIEQLSLPTLSENDHKLLNRLCNLESQVSSLKPRVSSLEQGLIQLQNVILPVSNQLQQELQQQGIDVAISYIFQPPDLSIPPMVEQLSRRVETVTTLARVYDSFTWLAIYGISGSGKTHLAVLLVQYIGTCCAWIKLRDLNIEKAVQELDKSLKLLTNLPPQSNRYNWYCHICQSLGNGALLVLDDLPELLGSDELSERLVQLARACNLYGVKLLSTSPYQLPFTLQELLEGQILYSTETPPFNDNEAAEILQAYGAPASVIQADTRFINILLAKQHPQLIVAIARYLRQHNWQTTGDIEERLFRGDYRSALNSQTVKRVLDSIEDENARDLLYRLCLTVGSFSQKDVQAVASVDPPIQRAIERLYTLVGLWVQCDVNERLLVSPLVKPLGSSNLLPETQKSCHQVLAELIISKHNLNSIDIENVIIHFLGAEDFNRAGLMLVSALDKLSKVDNAVYYGNLLSYWGSLPLPKEMNLSFRIILRGFQITARNKHNKPISYLTQDLDALLEEANEDDAIGVVTACMKVYPVFDQDDPIRANRYLRTVLQFLPSARILGNELVLPDSASLGFAIWTTAQGINTTEKLQDWINTVEQLTVEQRNFAFTHEVAELGCLIVSEDLWLKESEKPREEQNWPEVFVAYVDFAERAYRLDLELLWACAIWSKIIILAEYQHNISAAISVAEIALRLASSEPRVQFLIKGCIGQQLVNANRNNEAITWLSQALSENTNAYPIARIKALLSMSRATGEQDSPLAVEFARQAVVLAENTNNIDNTTLVKVLSEQAIAQGFSGEISAVFLSLDKAMKHLLACKSDTDNWKIIFTVFSHVTGYFTSIARTGSPPSVTRNGEPYATPRRGMFFHLNPEIVTYYRRNLECTTLANLAIFAQAIGNNERAAVWSLKGIDDARATNQQGVLATLCFDAIPYLLDENCFAEVLDIAIDAGLFFTASVHQLQTGQLPRNFEIDAEAILGDKPSELWLKAEQNTVLIGLLPTVFRIATVALHDSQFAKTQATEVAAICRQISTTSTDSYLWVTAAELLEQIYSQEASHDGILRYSRTFDSKNYAVLKVIGYLVATLQNDTPLSGAALEHSVIAPFVYNQPATLTTIYRQVILPFFVKYWKNKFESMPLSFHSTQEINQIFNNIETIPEAERLQMILVAVALSLNVQMPRNTTKWIIESSPGLVNFFG